jgi:hypothetical protein
MFIQGPILIPLDWIKEFHVRIDAFGTTIEVVLTQGQKNLNDFYFLNNLTWLYFNFLGWHKLFFSL